LEIEKEIKSFDRSASLQHRDWQHTSGSAKAHWRRSGHSPSIRPDLDHSPVLISEIEVDVTGTFGDADVHYPLRRVESAWASSKSSVESCTGGLIMGAP
jgi:hypothetical protein